MRLLSRGDDGTLNISADRPQTTTFAALSLTRYAEDQEVTYEDVISKIDLRAKAGYGKVNFCLEQARRDGLEQVWIDTCCINKQDKTDLGKALNKMYKWYQASSVCYVDLADVSAHDWQDTFCQSRWFKRGLTLQELLAPADVRFFSNEGQYLGNRNALRGEISLAAHIDSVSLQNVPLATRFSWSLHRETSEPEDLSYCMIGLLGVSLPASYGEGAEDAQERLLDAVHDKHGRRVVREIRRLIALHEFHLGAQSVDLLSPERVLSSLKFDNMNSRRATISDPYGDTCIWLQNHGLYLKWQRDDGYRFLWIKGKAGTDKSVLVKFIEASTLNECLHISFYFHARGTDLEKTIMGMYRSLLFQLLEQRPGLHKHVRKRLETLKSFTGGLIWNTATVQDILRACTKRLGSPVRCFIDALDECADVGISSAVYFLQDLCRDPQFYVFLASRHYPSVMINVPEIFLSDQPAHAADLSTYVYGRLQADDSLRAQGVTLANGVFLWAVLVVGRLNGSIAEGVVHDLQAVLRSQPGELDTLFKLICSRDGDLERFRTSLQWIVFAGVALAPEAFFDAVMISTDGSIAAQAEMSDLDYARFVTSASRGLAEVTKDEYPTVQLIHEPLRQFMLSADGLPHMFDETPDDLAANAHERLKFSRQQFICHNDLNAGDPFAMFHAWFKSHHLSGANFDNLMDILSAGSGRVTCFAEYAKSQLLVHANDAAKDVRQDDFISSPELARLHDHFWREVSGSHPFVFTTMSTFARFGADRLISAACRLGHDTEAPGSAGLTPLCIASLYGWVNCVTALLKDDANIEARAFTGHSALAIACSTLRSSTATMANTLLTRGADIDSVDLDGRTPIFCAIKARRGWFYVPATILSEPRVDDALFDRIVQAGGQHMWDLRFAAYGRQAPTIDLSCIEKLLHHGANVNVSDINGITPLIYASLHDDAKAIDALVKSRAALKTRGHRGRTALNLACAAGLPSSVSALIELGADASTQDYDGISALLATCSHGMSEMYLRFGHAIQVNHVLEQLRQLVEEHGSNSQKFKSRLVDWGFDGDLEWNDATRTILTNFYGTCMHLHDATIVTTLLKSMPDRAAVNRPGPAGCTPLGAACARGEELTPALLLVQHGADINLADDNGWTPLMLACKHDRRDATAWLIYLEADLGSVDKAGVSTMSYLSRWKRDASLQHALYHHSGYQLMCSRKVRRMRLKAWAYIQELRTRPSTWNINGKPMVWLSASCSYPNLLDRFLTIR